MAKPSTLHERLIGDLVADGASTRRLKESILDAIAGPCGSHELILDDDDDPDSGYHNCARCHLKEDLEGRVIPDAFLIDCENEHVIAYEVEVSHRVPDHKMETYRSWFWALDEDYWQLRLIIIDRFGNRHEVDLFKDSTDATERASPERIEEVRAWMGIRKPGEPQRKAQDDEVPLP